MGAPNASWAHVVAVLSLALIPISALTEQVRTDLLVGVGDFERSSFTRWYAAYKGTDYSYPANSLYVMSPAGDYTNGWSLPSPLDSVANGWIRTSSANVRPDRNLECSILSGKGIGGSNCQYFGLKDIGTGDASLRLDTHIPVDDSKPYRLHSGDQITLRIDHIAMSGLSGLPAGSSVRYLLWMDSYGSLATKEITPSALPSSSEISARVPDGARDINCIVEIRTTGDLGTARPGILIDGARIHVKRSGQAEYETKEFPLGRPRNVRNHLLFASIDDLYGIAGDYDVFPLTEGDYIPMRQLSVLNPAAEIAVAYSGAGVLDRRDTNGQPLWANQSVFQFVEVTKDHPEWLYPGGNGVGGYVNHSAYPERYPVRLTSATYQNEFVARIIERAHRFGVSAVWLDDTIDVIGSTYDDGKIKDQAIEPWEVQQFLHAVVPRLHAAGLKITQNCSARHYATGPGKVYFDPWWQPDADYPYSTGYRANSADNTPDVFFQEYGFFIPSKKQNEYRSRYWLECLQDMDFVKQLNEATGANALPPGSSKHLHVLVEGYDSTDDPAYGNDGWLQFGLCSYMLGHSDWSHIGFRIIGDRWVNPAPAIDWSITKRIGAPTTNHAAISDDPYFRKREFGSTADGGVGGIVVVNANADVQRTFQLDFDGIDEQGHLVARGERIVIHPHTGRMFLKQQGPVFVRIRVPRTSVSPGEIVTVTVDYLNDSASEVTGVVVRVAVPEEMVYQPGSAEMSGGSYDPASGTIVWQVGSVPASQGGRRTYTAKIR